MRLDRDPKSEYEGACRGHEESGKAVREVLDRIGDKWSLLVVVTLRNATLRFTELQHHIPGISQRMLTLTLRHLERDGLISRTVHAEVPPRVEYKLTAAGRTLVDAADGLANWAVTNYPSIELARTRYDAEQSVTD